MTTMIGKAGAPSYAADAYSWALHNAALLRAGRWQELDADNIAEELEDMSGSKERELESRLGILLAHLLKWVYQTERRSNSWRTTIKEQRRRLARLLRNNPGLKAKLDTAFEDAYGDALLIASRETGLDETLFPQASPFSVQQTLDDSYWP